MFTHLHVHTHYSLLEAIGSPKAYIDRAAELGMHTLACTDYAGMYGAIEFYQAAKKNNIKPILWVELGYVRDMTLQDPQESAGTIVLLARTYTWYQQLLQLISAAHLHWFNKIPRIDPQCLKKRSTDLIALSGGERSRIGKLLANKTDAAFILDQRDELHQILGKDASFLMRIAQETPKGETHEVNELIRQFWSTQSIPLLVSWDVHYIHEQDKATYEIALAIKDGKRIYDTDRRLADHHMHLQSSDELIERWTKTTITPEQRKEMMETTSLIAEQIDITIPMDTILFPVYTPPEEIVSMYEKYKDTLIVSSV